MVKGTSKRNKATMRMEGWHREGGKKGRRKGELDVWWNVNVCGGVGSIGAAEAGIRVSEGLRGREKGTY